MGAAPGSLGHVAMIGSGVGVLELAAVLARAGTRVTIVEPDPHDRDRLATILSRSGVSVTLAASLPGTGAPDLCLLASDGAAPPLIPSARLGPTGQGAPMIIDLHHLPGLPPLLEAGLADPAFSRIARGLAASLGATLALRDGTGPAPGARLQGALWRAADDLVLAGAALWEIDEDLESAGFAIGPYAAQDMTGLDHALTLRRLLAPDNRNPLTPRAHAEGRIGRALGWGWYRYPGGGGRVIDPLTQDLALEEARFAWIVPRDIPADEGRARLLDSLVTETCTLIQDGVPRQTILLALRLAIGCPSALLADLLP